jgi:hypothetical protein
MHPSCQHICGESSSQSKWILSESIASTLRAQNALLSNVCAGSALHAGVEMLKTVHILQIYLLADAAIMPVS